MSARAPVLPLAFAFALIGCSEKTERPGPPGPIEAGPPVSMRGWQEVFAGLPGGLISVWGSSERDVWTVGSAGNDGRDPMILHYDGAGWTRFLTGVEGDLWWVHGFADGSVLFGGTGGQILRYENGTFSRERTPSSETTIFGIWGSSPSDVWAVGGDTLGSGGANVWRYDGSVWTTVSDVPRADEAGLFFKVWGTGGDDVWIVGGSGVVVHYDGTGFTPLESAITEALFTVHTPARDATPVAVGGLDVGVAVALGPTMLEPLSLPSGTRQLFGVWLTGSESGYVVGDRATVLRRQGSGFTLEHTGLATDKALHAVWVDPVGGVWTVGGDVLVPPLGEGTLLHKGARLPRTYEDRMALIEPFEAGLPAMPEAGADARAGAPDASFDARDGETVSDARLDAPPPPPIDAPAREAGRVPCGAASCDLSIEVCCVDRAGVEPSSCLDTSTACPNGFFSLACDERADCMTGTSCCLSRFIQSGAIARAECLPECRTQVLCASDAECDGKTCTLSSAIADYPTCL